MRFVAQSFLKGSLKSHQRNSKHFARARRNDAVYIQSYGWKGWRACAWNTPASMKDGSGEKTGFHLNHLFPLYKGGEKSSDLKEFFHNKGTSMSWLSLALYMR